MYGNDWEFKDEEDMTFLPQGFIAEEFASLISPLTCK